MAMVMMTRLAHTNKSKTMIPQTRVERNTMISQQTLYSQTELLSWKVKGLSGIVQNDISRMLENGETTLKDIIASRTYTDKEFKRCIKELYDLRTTTLEFLDSIIHQNQAPTATGSGLRTYHEITWTRKILDGKLNDQNIFSIDLYDNDTKQKITTFNVTIEVDEYNDTKYIGPECFKEPTMFVYKHATPKTVEDNWITCRRCGKRDITIKRNECDYCWNKSMNGE